MFIEDNDGLQIRLHLFKFSQRVLCVIQKRLDPQHTISQRNTKWAADMPPPHFSSVQSLSRVKLFGLQHLWTAAHQASLYLTKFRSLLKLMSMESVMLSNHLILCHPFSSRLQSFPTSGPFQISQFFASGGQSIGVSASASGLTINIQD